VCADAVHFTIPVSSEAAKQKVADLRDRREIRGPHPVHVVLLPRNSRDIKNCPHEELVIIIAGS
jgi:predicted P-loop ATPase/GTPase